MKTNSVIIKLIKTGLLILFCQVIVSAQQDANFTMYMFNPLNYNPAYAGIHENINGSLYYRKQWLGFNAVNGGVTPEVQNLSVIVPFKRNNFGLGLNVQNDRIGITGNIRPDVSFGYYIPLKEGKLAFGLSVGLQSYRVNSDQLLLENNADQAFTNNAGNINRITPDFGFGVFYSKTKYFIGLSLRHLNGAGRSLTGYKTGDIGAVARQYYLTAGYNIEITDKFVLTPSFLTSFSESKFLQRNLSTDIALKLEYKEMVWFGTSYRTSDALNFFVGVNLGKINSDAFRENIRIGYAVDCTVSQLPTYNSGGTHEIFISYDYIPKIKRMMPKFK